MGSQTMEQSIFIVVGSTSDNLVLNETTDIKVTDCLECWSPDQEVYFCAINDIAGNILEVSDIINTEGYADKIPVGSMAIVAAKGDIDWFIDQYYSGKYNDKIKELMAACHITDYQLPKPIKR